MWHFDAMRALQSDSERENDRNTAKQQLKLIRLRKDIQKLLATRQRLEPNRLSTDFHDTVAGIARAYYEVFRSGYIAENASISAHGDVPSFLYAVIDTKMRAGSHQGIHLMFMQWQRYTEMLAFSHFTLCSLSIVPTDGNVVVKTRGSFRFVVTRDTMSGIFPHVLGNEMLLQRILGLRLECDCQIDLYFDACGRVVRYSEFADFMGAFAIALTNVADLSFLMDGALIHEESMLGNEADFAMDTRDIDVP